MDAIERFTENIVRTTYEMLPASALAATKTFILDTLGISLNLSMQPPVLHGDSGDTAPESVPDS